MPYGIETLYRYSDSFASNVFYYYNLQLIDLKRLNHVNSRGSLLRRKTMAVLCCCERFTEHTVNKPFLRTAWTIEVYAPAQLRLNFQNGNWSRGYFELNVYLLRLGKTNLSVRYKQLQLMNNNFYKTRLLRKQQKIFIRNGSSLRYKEKKEIFVLRAL